MQPQWFRVVGPWKSRPANITGTTESGFVARWEASFAAAVWHHALATKSGAASTYSGAAGCVFNQTRVKSVCGRDLLITSSDFVILPLEKTCSHTQPAPAWVLCLCLSCMLVLTYIVCTEFMRWRFDSCPHTRVRSWNLCTQLSSLLSDYLINNPDKIPSRAERYSSQPGSSVTALQAIVNLLNMKFINYSFSCIQHNSSLIAMRTFATLGTSKWNVCLAWFSIILFQSQIGEKKYRIVILFICVQNKMENQKKKKIKIDSPNLLEVASWVCSCSYKGRTLKVASWHSG